MLNLVKSNRMEVLMEALAALLARGPDDPFTPEWIGVQSRGMKQWISLRLADILGISANVKFVFPREIIQQFLDRNQGISDIPILNEDILIWSVMAQLDTDPGASPLKDVTAYFSQDISGKKQIQLASRIASILDDYQVYRPEMLLGWEKNAPPKYARNPVEKWQSFLWRNVVENNDCPSLPAQMESLLDAAVHKKLADLPHRICLFGLSMVPPSFTDLFSALDTDVFVFLLTPSNQFFFDIASPKQMGRLALENTAGSGADPIDGHYEIANPLLASLGRSGRQFHAGLEALHYLEPFEDLFMDPAPPGAPACMLHQLQSDILHLVDRGNGCDHKPVPVASHDRSICIHACHSPMREAQVLKDLLLDEFVQNPDLAPHEVAVMMPDIETYAPYIEAVFSLEYPVPFSISDRRHKTESPTIGAFVKILDMKGSRLEQSRVLDLLLCSAIAEKFEISQNDIQILEDMVSRAGILWGKDREHRRQVTGRGFRENTWQFGLQRLFMGYALPGTQEVLVNDVLPCPFFEGLDADVLGRFTHFCHTLFYHLAELDGKKTVSRWDTVFTNLILAMMAPAESRQADIRFLIQACEGLSRGADAAGFTGELSFEAVLDMLTTRLDQTIAQGSFLAGGITFCNLMPMRSIPFKVVALMGMDEASFPRKIFVPGFDLISAFPCAGDKNIRDEDRYLFLETLLSARQRLIITYTGMGIKDNCPIPCSGVISELADVMDQSFAFAPGYTWWFTHPLHGFSQAYFDPNSDFFSYSADQCCIARSMNAPAGEGGQTKADQESQDQIRQDQVRQHAAGQSATGQPAAAEILAGQYQAGNNSNTGETDPDSPPQKDGDTSGSEGDAKPITLWALHRFFRHPLEMFCKTALDMEFALVEEPLPDREPFQASGLTRYHLGSWFLQKDPNGTQGSGQAWYPLVRAGGQLPLGNQGRLQWQSVVDTALPIKSLAQKHMPDISLDPVTADVVLENTRVSGLIADLFAEDDSIVRCVAGFGRINAPRLLVNWITHLALTLAMPDSPVETRLIGQDPTGRQGVVIHKFVPVGDQAGPILSDLVSVYEKGLQKAWAFFPNTCFLVAKTLAQHGYEISEYTLGLVLKTAEPAWFSAFTKTGEKTDRYAAAWCTGRPDPFDNVDQLSASGIVPNAVVVYRPLLGYLEPRP